MKKWLLLALLCCACGTQTVRVEPVTVQPIHITVDVNLHDKAGDAARPAAR